MIMGFISVFMASLGNTTHLTETCFTKFTMTTRLLIGMGVVSFATVVSFFEESQTNIWNTTKDPVRKPAYWAGFIVGLSIMAFQLLRLLGIYFPLGPLEAGGMEKKENTSKAAASYKVLGMVEHAMLLHDVPSSNLESMRASSISKTVLEFAVSLHSNSKRSTTSSKGNKALADLRGTTNKALLNFHRMQDTREDTGGVVWTLRKTLNRSLFLEDGIYLHGRLMAVNMVQFFIVTVMIALFVFGLRTFEDTIGFKDEKCTITIGPDGVSGPTMDPDWNLTENGFYNVFNVNSTHFYVPVFDLLDNPDDGLLPEFNASEAYGVVYPGQLPKFKGEEYLLGDLLSPTLCYENAFGAWTLNTSGVYTNEAAAHNAFVEALNIKEWE